MAVVKNMMMIMMMTWDSLNRRWWVGHITGIKEIKTFKSRLNVQAACGLKLIRFTGPILLNERTNHITEQEDQRDSCSNSPQLTRRHKKYVTRYPIVLRSNPKYTTNNDNNREKKNRTMTFRKHFIHYHQNIIFYSWDEGQRTTKAKKDISSNYRLKLIKSNPV